MRIWGGFQEIAPTRGGAISWNSQIRIEMAPVILLAVFLDFGTGEKKRMSLEFYTSSLLDFVHFLANSKMQQCKTKVIAKFLSTIENRSNIMCVINILVTLGGPFKNYNTEIWHNFTVLGISLLPSTFQVSEFTNHYQYFFNIPVVVFYDEKKWIYFVIIKSGSDVLAV